MTRRVQNNNPRGRDHSPPFQGGEPAQAGGVVTNDAKPPHRCCEASDFQSGALRDSYVTTLTGCALSRLHSLRSCPSAPEQGGFATFCL